MQGFSSAASVLFVCLPYLVSNVGAEAIFDVSLPCLQVFAHADVLTPKKKGMPRWHGHHGTICTSSTPLDGPVHQGCQDHRHPPLPGRTECWHELGHGQSTANGQNSFDGQGTGKGGLGKARKPTVPLSHCWTFRLAECEDTVRLPKCSFWVKCTRSES